MDQNLYSERLEEARSETERLALSIRRIKDAPLEKLVKRLEEAQVLAIHSDLLREIREFVQKAWGLVYRATICHFFEQENAGELRRVIFRINKAANSMDDFLSETLPRRFQELDERVAKRASTREGGEREFLQAERIKLKYAFLEEREAYAFRVREGVRIMEMVKRGEVREALRELLSKNNPLYVEKEPSEFLPKQPESIPEVEKMELEGQA